jgi:hypothetical protein
MHNRCIYTATLHNILEDFYMFQGLYAYVFYTNHLM